VQALMQAHAAQRKGWVRSSFAAMCERSQDKRYQTARSLEITQRGQFRRATCPRSKVSLRSSHGAGGCGENMGEKYGSEYINRVL
jgi:hypothetical protein